MEERTFSVLPMIENVYDVGNFLAVCRSCEVFGVGGVGIISGKDVQFEVGQDELRERKVDALSEIQKN